MKFVPALLAAAAATAFALPAAAQESQDSTTTAPAAEAARQPAAEPAPVQAGTPPQATASDLTVGAQVLGSDGQPVGTIAEADATGAVVKSDAGQGRLNLDAFFKDARGLLIGYSRAEFNALVGGNG